MANPQVKEFVIRVPKKNDLQRFSVLKFNAADNIDTTRWNESEIRMERVDNKGVVLSSEVVQEFGEGSEYGKAAREEARRKKYGRMARTYRLDNQPWNLSITTKDSKERRLNSIREGEGHSDNWVFLKNGEEFHAYKVDAMHRFTPAITHKTLDIDQAEEKFLERNKVMNQFALKAQIQNQTKTGDEDGEMTDMKQAKNLKIKDGYSSDESDNEEAGEDNEKPKVKKGKKNAKPKKDKRQRVENGDEVAKYESSDGEDEGREYDYMSDSGSDSDREDVKAEEKVDKELVGVGDETGLKKMMDSDEESSSDEDDLAKKLLNRDDSKKKENADIEERDSSGSDSDDPDKEKIDSVVFLQKKEVGESSNAKKRPATAAAESNEPKRAKAEESNVPEGLNEETVRKYLRRKPHTTKELLAKINAKCTNLSKPEIVNKLACILKAIEPHQFKQKQGKKEVLFFSLTNNLA